MTDADARPLSLTFGERNAAFLSTAEDFRKQRTKITRRIHKLRKYLKIQVKNTKNYKKVDFTVEDYDSNEKYYLLSLLSIEKNWVYALELKQLISLTSSNATSYKAKQKLLLTRLKRSVNLASNLVNISVNEPNGKKLIEILVYKELLNGVYNIDLKKWNNAIKSFSIARLALQYLEQEGGFVENKILYKDIIEETIDESLKLAIYRSENKTSVELTDYTKNVASSLSSTKLYQLISSKDAEFLKPTESSSLVNEIQWRDYSARIKDDTSSRLLSKVLKIELSSLESFDTALSLWQDLLENHQTFISKEQEDDDSQDNQIFLAYIKYNSLLTRLTRDQTLLSDNQKESLRLLDTIVHTLKEMSELPGVYSDEELSNNLKTISLYYSNLKLRILSLFFFNKREYAKTLLLTSKIVESLDSLKLTIDDFTFISNDDISKLSKDSGDLLKNSHVLAQIEAQIPNNRFVSNDLNKYSKDYKNIVGFELETVPVKPVLFDVAYNYVTYTKDNNKGELIYEEVAPAPTPVSKTPEPVKEEPKKKRGWGLFGR